MGSPMSMNFGSLTMPRAADRFSVTEGYSVICLQEPDKVYRWHEGELHHYPTGTIASSWDEDWREALEMDCSNIPKGEPMSNKNTINLTSTIEGVCSSDSNDTKIVRTCKTEVSAHLLSQHYSPLMGQTYCDDKCTFSMGLSCVGKVSECASPCNSNPDSQQCLECTKDKDFFESPCCDCIVNNALLGCSWWDAACFFKEAECTICNAVVPELIALGSDVACDAGCVSAVELIGGGPEDPVADAVASSCVPLCGLLFEGATSPLPEVACKAIDMCE
jgi:hypothetical protein